MMALLAIKLYFSLIKIILNTFKHYETIIINMKKKEDKNNILNFAFFMIKIATYNYIFL